MHRLALILLATTTACIANSGDEGFSIVHNLAPTAGCMVSPGGGFLSRGTIDIASPNPYLMTPEFSSRISAGEGTVAQRTIALRGARIEITVASGGQTLVNNKFTSLFAASLSPLGSTTAAFDAVPLEILDQLTITGTERIQLLAKITAYGALGGSGDEIDGVPFEYPVSVCNGCVAQNLGACPLPAGTMLTEGANPCNAFQDGVVQCCTSASGLICPATVATAAR